MACLSPAATHADIVSNGSFELGPVNNETNAFGWTQFEIDEVPGPNPPDIPGLSTALTDRVAMMANEGDYAMLLRVDAGFGAGPAHSVLQHSPASGSVIGGTEYDFSFFSKGEANEALAFYEVQWLDTNGDSIGSATGLQEYSASLGTSYVEVESTGLIAPPTADTVLIRIELESLGFGFSASSAFIDNVSFSAVTSIPEPTSACYLTGLSLGLILRRRR